MHAQPTANAGQAVRYADEDARRLVEPRLGELADPHGRWRQVKQNASRTVLRGQLDGQGVYLKRFHQRSTVHRTARKLGLSDAAHEFDAALNLREHGVTTPEPLAVCCDQGSEWVLTREVDSATPADQWGADRFQRDAKGLAVYRRATVLLGELVARMHNAGVLHQDLHTGNVLVQQTDKGLDLLLMDLHRTVRRRRLSRLARAKNLAMLYHDRLDFTTRTDRLRFLAAYLRVSGGPGTLRGWTLLVEKFGWAHRRKIFAKRDRRILSEGKYFAPLEIGDGWRGHAVLASKRRLGGSRAAQRTFTAEQWAQALAEPEDLFEGEGVEVVKDSRSSLVVRRTLRVGERDVDVFIKRPRRKKAWKAIADMLRWSRPKLAFVKGHQLLTRYIATALPVAYLERRRGRSLNDCLLITEAVGAPKLTDFLNRHLGERPTGDERLDPDRQRSLARDVLAELGRLLQNLHDNSCAHRDLKGSKILVRWEPGQRPELVLIDLDGLKRLWHVSAQRRLQGLMRLNVSLLKCPPVNHAGRLRMLVSYLRRPGVGRIAFKPYWRLLETWSARKLDAQIRSRRQRQKQQRRPA